MLPSSPRGWARVLVLAGALTAPAASARAADGPAPHGPAAAAAPATGTYRLTLEDAKRLAVQNNKSMALARLNVAEKGHGADAARKDYFPKVIALDSYFHFNDNLGSVLTVRRGRFGLLPPGTIPIDASVLNRDSNLATVMVAQPITKLIAVHAAVQVARAEQSAAQAQLDKGQRDLVSGVAQAYYGLAGAQRIQSALELQAGVLEQVLQAQPSAELRVALVEVRQGVVQVRGQVRELMQQLNDLLDLPPATVLELVDPVPGDLAAHSAEEAAELALACSPEVREAREDVVKAEAATKLARMAYLPDVSVVGGYSNQTVANYIQPNIGYLGLTGSMTLFEWGKKRDVVRQRQTLIALAHQKVQVTIDKVRLDARKAYGSYEQAREEYQLAGDMVQARQEAEKAAKGPAAVRAKADTAKAELDRMKAEIAYRVAHAQLAAAIGQQ